MTIFLYPHNSLYGGLTEFVPHLFYSNKLKDTKLWKPEEDDHLDPQLKYFGYGLTYRSLDSNWFFGKTGLRYFILGLKSVYMNHIKKISRSKITAVVHGTLDLDDGSIKYIEKDWNSWSLITVREAIRDYYEEKYNIEMECLKLPFYEYRKKWTSELVLKEGAISICRIGFDKNINMIINANKLIKNENNMVRMYGHISHPLYVTKVVGKHNLDKYYHGEYRREFSAMNDLILDSKYLVDMTFHPYDGGGTQYAFLNAWHLDCALVVFRKWIENVDKKYRELKEGYNCLAVDNEKELAELLNKDNDVCKIVDNSKKLLNEHIHADWSPYIF